MIRLAWVGQKGECLACHVEITVAFVDCGCAGSENEFFGIAMLKSRVKQNARTADVDSCVEPFASSEFCNDRGSGVYYLRRLDQNYNGTDELDVCDVAVIVCD